MEPSSNAIELCECDRRFRAAFVDAAIGVAIFDSSGRFIFANTAFCRLTGYAEHELCGMHFTATLHPDDPYIAINDAPKVENLRKELPELYKK